MARKRTPPTLLATRRFVKDYRKANATIADGARREVDAFVRSAVLIPDWLHKHDKIEGLGTRMPGRFVELEIGSGPRLVAYVNGMDITLIALGDHEVVTRLKKQRNLPGELEQLADLPAGFGVMTIDDAVKAFAESVAAALNGTVDRSRTFGPEVDLDWLHFLSDEQEEMFLNIAEDIETAMATPGTATAHLIEGGPGTGKTSVLLRLLDHFAEEGHSVGLDMSEHLVEFIKAQTGRDLREFTAPIENGEPVRICLVDDPASLQSLRWDARRARENLGELESTAVVVAFDPLQVEGRRDAELTDAALEEVREAAYAKRWVLRDCYRQKEFPGAAARSLTGVIMGSSPFLADKKRAAWAESRAQIAEAALDLRFINPGGHFTVYDEAQWSDWTGYLATVGTATWATMREGDPRAWPRLAVVAPMDAVVPESWAPPLRDVQHHFISGPGWQQRLRGVEYAHVAVLLTQSELAMVTSGFTGTGRTEYGRFQLLRIPFSRARDSLAVFAVPPSDR